MKIDDDLIKDLIELFVVCNTGILQSLVVRDSQAEKWIIKKRGDILKKLGRNDDVFSKTEKHD